MKLSDEQLESFIELFYKEFGVTLNKKDARFRAESLLYFLSFSVSRKN